MVGKIPKNHKILTVFPFYEKIFTTKKHTGPGHLHESRGLPINYIYIGCHLFILNVGLNLLTRLMGAECVEDLMVILNDRFNASILFSPKCHPGDM